MSRQLLEELEKERNHADAMARIAAIWMERAQAAELNMAILVDCAGGEIIVPETTLAKPEKLTLWQWRDPARLSLVFRTRRNSDGMPVGTIRPDRA